MYSKILCIIKKYFIPFMACVYILIGMGIYKDYGISTDEPNERATMYINLNYMTTLLGKPMEGVPRLDEYVDRYYGIFLQMPTALFEVGSKGLDYIYSCRHLYTFGVCVIGYIAFFYLCKRLFNSNLLALLGTAMVALYPRFFAEQFYNIKDMVFVSVYMIAMWATYMLIESKFSWKNIIIFSFMSALATNVRIVGAVFIILLIGYMWIACILESVYATGHYNLTWKKTLIVSAAIVAAYFIFLVLMYPVAWENPVGTLIEIFTKFTNYDDWHGVIVFMGKVISKEEVPWYYVPVWMLISVPVWYLILFLISLFSIVKNIVRKKKEKSSFFEYQYLIWCILLVAVPFGAILIKNATLYNGWRHCYFLLPPLILLGIYGVDYIVKGKRRYYKIAVFSLITFGMVLQMGWICFNHPHEMVYFNSIGKMWASDFDRDYWNMVELQAYEYIMENDDGSHITIDSGGGMFFLNMLNDEEKARFERTENAMYYIETYRGKVGNEVSKEGYEEIHSITVDNFKVASIFKKKGSLQST